jgi:predicted nucleotidyltransferase
VSPGIPDASRRRPICRKYGVSSLAVFGSCARNEAGPESDLDLLVSFTGRIGLLRMVALERELSELVGRKVDLQTEGALSPYHRDQILHERKIIYAASG